MNVLRRLLYLNSENECENFITPNKSVNVHNICTNDKVVRIFTFVKTFRNIFGCPPSEQIVKNNYNNTVHFIQSTLGILKQEFIQQEYHEAKQKMNIPTNLREEMVNNLLHFSNSKEKEDKSNIIKLFINIFKNTKNWNDKHLQINNVFQNWENVYKAVNATCFIVSTDNVNLTNKIANILSEIEENKIHVFQTQENNWNRDFIVHKEELMCFPINLFTQKIEICENQIIINGCNLYIPIENALVNKYDILSNVLKLIWKHKNTCIQQCIVFWNNVIQLWNNTILTHTQQQSFTGHDSGNAIICVETRDNLLTVMSCLLTSYNLDKTKWMGIVLFCRSKHTEFYKQYIGKHIVTIINLEELESDKFNIEDYNTLMKSDIIWSRLNNVGVKKVLTIQDDGFLIRKGAENFLNYDYVGAPWTKNSVLELISNKELVGNGGLSIRSVEAMKEISQTQKLNEQYLNLPIQIPEDVFFSKQVENNNKYKLCKRNEASKFASEQIINKYCCGIHKPWPYHHSCKDIESLFELK